MSIYDTYKKVISTGGMNVENVKNLIVLEVKNLKEALYFYEGILGIKPSLERPQLDVTGVWYDTDSTRISFVMNRMLGGREKSFTNSCAGLTFSISNIENLKKRLVFYKIAYTENKSEKSIVVQDPDGYKLQVIEKDE
ncbi:MULTISPECIES: VOC family protein [Bacillus]|uniref:Lactoylglutathione lyase n=2 Tax=Bacillus thuringiensis TaxID=1428 RepID=A0AAP4Q7I8_BACTU|nr:MULTISPECIES: VOC family protein [Bacillus]MEC2875157.1 lactoylglutathione lyase [Bacillus cereus]EEM30378.1 Lactoylglutathione lyase [Bacillus thuringiensis Bt407]EEM36695.1 Lactoylglutathione lyase [Bacillus thuringiensis serovar thuringiensis str. T01001]EEM67559.1 Lactoylglutathione lyase [Bacillus thuringiensis serovar berliner ATCC 10792]MBN6704264.1 lactoylglutathione lyase [Bacillus thuringiensis]